MQKGQPCKPSDVLRVHCEVVAKVAGEPTAESAPACCESQEQPIQLPAAGEAA